MRESEAMETSSHWLQTTYRTASLSPLSVRFRRVVNHLRACFTLASPQEGRCRRRARQNCTATAPPSTPLSISQQLTSSAPSADDSAVSRPNSFKLRSSELQLNSSHRRQHLTHHGCTQQPTWSAFGAGIPSARGVSQRSEHAGRTPPGRVLSKRDETPDPDSFPSFWVRARFHSAESALGPLSRKTG